MYKLTEKGIKECERFIAECEAKRKEILDARLDTADETNLPTAEAIESDINAFGVDENGDYFNGWGVTDNYNSDYPIGLTLGVHFVELEETYRFNYEWKYGENQFQVYYDTTVDGTYLLVFRNKVEDYWMCMIGNRMIENKTRNNRYRNKKGVVDAYGHHSMLSSKEPTYLIKKVEYCYKHNQFEISE